MTTFALRLCRPEPKQPHPHPAEKPSKPLRGLQRPCSPYPSPLLKVLASKPYPALVAPAYRRFQTPFRVGGISTTIAAVGTVGSTSVESTDNNFPTEQHPAGLNGAQVFLINGQGPTVQPPTEDVAAP